MASDQVQLAATCALGQLEAHMGKFGDAEETLTKALNKAELLYGTSLCYCYLGPRHPKVGLVLTCLALMLRQKAIQERSSSLLIQEGLYRRAIELLKAPPVETEGSIGFFADRFGLFTSSTLKQPHNYTCLTHLTWSGIAAGYAEVLCIQDNRKSEGEKMKSWAEAQWRNSRLSLAEALRISESSNRVLVIDARTARAL
ncbi:hypothetical protein LINPERHAP1_LOCUS39534 [Linum perenne]